MARKSKGEITINKKHGGKEFNNSFHFVGKVKPVQKKDEATDSWYEVEIFDTNLTKSKKERRVTQFIVETANRNDLKVESAGMEQDIAFIYSSTHKRTERIPFAQRHDKSVYPDETYHLIDTDWDKAEKFGKMVEKDMWVDVKGHYEFSTFESDGEEITVVKRIIDQLMPLKNGTITIKGLIEGDTFRAYDSEKEGKYLGMGKANKEGIATLRVGWLNPEGGTLYLVKLEGDTEGQRVKIDYTDETVEVNDRITVANNTTSSIRLPKVGSTGYEYVDYIRDFKSEEFNEINSFEMQLGIKSTYQDENTLNTKVNGVFLSYGKESSQINDVTLNVIHKEASEGKQSLATAFSRLESNSFLVVEGIDHNRMETMLIEVQAGEDDPFADVDEKKVEYQTVSAGTNKGLEITQYIQGSYIKDFLTDDEMYKPKDDSDPFASNNTPQEFSVDDLPF
jgi:hypothetical protein